MRNPKGKQKNIAETLITFLTLENNNLNIHCHASINSNIWDSIRYYCNVLCFQKYVLLVQFFQKIFD